MRETFTADIHDSHSGPVDVSKSGGDTSTHGPLYKGGRVSVKVSRSRIPGRRESLAELDLQCVFLFAPREFKNL